MKNKTWYIIFALALLGPSVRAEQSLGFVEVWNNVGYLDTNVEKKGFASLLGRLEGRAGLQLFNQPLQVYAAFYGTAGQSNDYWNNSQFTGLGIRYWPLTAFQAKGWQFEWLRDIKVYYETLGSGYFKNAASAESAGLRTTDARYGLEVWHEWNLDNINPGYNWGELWSNLSFRGTNFSSSDFNSYIFYCQPKVGWHLPGGVQSYLKTDLTYSGQSSYWLNTAVYGLGLRFQPWRATGKPDDLMAKFKMFVEILGVSYLKDKPTDTVKIVSTDLRFGLDLAYGAFGR